MTSPAPIPTERLIKLSKLRGDKFQEEAAMARELLSLRQQAQPTREEGWRVKPLEEALISTVRLLRARANAGSWWNDHAIWEHCRDLERKLIGFQGTGDGSPKFRALLPIDEPAREGGGEVRASLHNLTGIVRTDKPGLGLHEDYTPLYAASTAPSVSEPVPYAWEFGRSNGDDTYSVVIERGRERPKDAHPDWPPKPLYTAQP